LQLHVSARGLTLKSVIQYKLFITSQHLTSYHIVYLGVGDVDVDSREVPQCVGSVAGLVEVTPHRRRVVEVSHETVHVEDVVVNSVALEPGRRPATHAVSHVVDELVTCRPTLRLTAVLPRTDRLHVKKKSPSRAVGPIGRR